MFSKKGNYLKFGLPFWIILILSCCDDIERWEREKAVGPLIAALRDRDRDWNVRIAAAKALGKIGKPAVEPLIVALGGNRYWDVPEILDKIDPNWRKSKAAQRQVSEFITALRDKSEDVRQDAADALGRIRDSRAVEPLIAVLRDKSEGVRMGAAWALGQIGDKRAVEPLFAALRDKSEGVRLYGTLGSACDK